MNTVNVDPQSQPLTAAGGIRVINPEASEVGPSSAFIDGSHTCNGKTLNYKLFKPIVVDGSAAPLVVMLHGCTQDPRVLLQGHR